MAAALSQPPAAVVNSAVVNCRTIDAAKKGLFVGGVQLPLALAELGLIDKAYEFLVWFQAAGPAQIRAFLGPPVGFEPTTPALQERCSGQLS